ncbi:MAG TPA: M56 family metallopeptidase [Ideonella sp.]|jgi:beta-lactamase regulating signal transducer with metallopeptidase domain|nr:M56 family metallopeptidase [Ideonella sp.]
MSDFISSGAMAPSALAYSLLQALWQLAAVGLVAAVVLALMRCTSAAARHMVAMGFLVAMLALPAWTFIGALANVPTAASGLAMATSPLGAATPSLHTLPAVAGFTPPSFAPPAWLAWLWAAGVLLMLARLAGGAWVLGTMDRHAATVLPARWVARAEALRRAMGIGRSVAVRLLDTIDLPFAARAWRPVIWLPATMLTRLAPDQIEALIAHELAHVRRLDWLWNGLQCAIEALLFFHPAVWWLSARVRQERENACDDLAAAACGDEIVVAEALLALEGLRQPMPRLALAAGGGALRARIARLLGGESKGGWSWVPSLGLAALMCVGALLTAQSSIAAAPAQPAVPAVPATPASAGASGAAAEPARDPLWTYVGESVRIRKTVDGHQRDYHRWVDPLGNRHETYRVDGQLAAIDDSVRQWVDHHREPPPPPPLPPIPPAPPLPPVPPVPPMPDKPPIPPVPPLPPELSDMPAYQALVQQIQQNPQATALLGAPITVGTDCHPCRLERDKVSLHLTAQGPKAKARLAAEGHLQDGQWRYQQLQLQAPATAANAKP